MQQQFDERSVSILFLPGNVEDDDDDDDDAWTNTNAAMGFLVVIRLRPVHHTNCCRIRRHHCRRRRRHGRHHQMMKLTDWLTYWNTHRMPHSAVYGSFADKVITIINRFICISIDDIHHLHS